MAQYPPRDLQNNPAWRGIEAHYTSKHKRVYRRRGKPDHCSRCGTSESGRRYEWANLTGDYDDLDDFAAMCKPCHRAYDTERGVHPCGTMIPTAKLTEDIVRTARARHAAGEAIRALAREYGVTQKGIRDALRRNTWKHVA